MEEKLMKLGGSMKVPNVQELAKGKLESVPSRYVRPDQEQPSILTTTKSLSLPQVPVLDMMLLLSPDTSVASSELQKLHCACKDWGFFQLINHGVRSSLVEKVKVEITEFFNLPMEEKSKYKQEPGDVEGYGQAFVMSEEQKLDWADLFYMVTLPTHLRKPHLLPLLPPPFRNCIEEYSKELKKLAMDLLELLTKALKMKSEDMKEIFEEGMQSMRMNYYPPCPQPELVIGINPHSDPGGLTILLQINEKEGLQIKKDGQWIPITPLPNAFIVNVGDALEIVSNGTYRSVEHRATVNSEKERLSIATFLNPKLDGDLGPALSLLTPETPPLFKRVTVEEYFRTFFARELQGKSQVEAFRIPKEKPQHKTN